MKSVTDKTNLLPRTLREERHFRWRGGEVSRIEALSDAVFAFSLTLLVVALEVPESASELVNVFWQFPAFALCFLFLIWVWYEHFIYHRRFGFEDTKTIALNGFLLFFVVFYVYPLKFLASALITNSISNHGVDFRTLGRPVMLLYSGGFVGIFLVFSIMYARAWSLRRELDLNPREDLATRGALYGHLISVSIGLFSMVSALISPKLLPLSGLIYFAMGPAQAINGSRIGRQLKRLEAEEESEES